MRRESKSKAAGEDRPPRTDTEAIAERPGTEDRRLDMFDTFPLWPARASTTAGNVDALFIFLVALSALMTAAIFTMIVVFAIRYRRRRGVVAEQIEGSTALEITWSVIPFCIFMVIFVWGAVIYFKERTPPRGATEVYVVAKQWMWKLEHEEGQREINELHVPVGRDVKLIMTSQDVIHSFYVPAFRIKQDVLPGRYTIAWFHPTKAGTYHLFCAEYCGTQHSGMIGHCGAGTGAVRGLDERRRSDRTAGFEREKYVPQLGCSPATAPTARAVVPISSGSSASRCNWKTDAWSPPTKTTFANPF